MGSVGNQNPWTPYYNFKDCSLGICSIYCPQFCYFIFPPPPPPSSSSTPFSPLIISIIGILTSAFILVSYYTIVTRYCKGNNRNTGAEGEEFVHNQWPVASTGLDESIIKTITVCKYRKGEGLIEGTECAVCLSEFQENEPLRLLPKCSHAFHLPCIDTWLKSQSNCPLCRANVTAQQPSTDTQASVGVGVNAYEIRRPDDLVLVVDGCELDCCEQVVDGLILKSPVREDGVCDVQSVAQFRRSVSLGALQVENDRFVEIKRCNSTGRFMPILTTV